MIGPQLQLWDEQQVCAVCALEKSLGGRNGTAQTGPEFSTSLQFRLGLPQKLRVSSAAGPAGESQGRGSAPSDAESRRVTAFIHGLSAEFS